MWGGALAPRGIDRPGTGRDTHSPTTFIRDLGAAFRASGRDSRPGRLRLPSVSRQLLGATRPPDRPGVDVDPCWRTGSARSWTRRSAPACRHRAGLGVESAIPAAKASAYEGDEPTKPVDEATQADFYRGAIGLAACQQGVEGLLSSHSTTSGLAVFQSGVYVDGTPESEPRAGAASRSRAPGAAC